MLHGGNFRYFFPDFFFLACGYPEILSKYLLGLHPSPTSSLESSPVLGVMSQGEGSHTSMHWEHWCWTGNTGVELGIQCTESRLLTWEVLAILGCRPPAHRYDKVHLHCKVVEVASE